ncbi:hypothetical protein [Lysinibacillus fusiformis]|uniref:hypothetical protein n=1 Tax=Lysinibacillus fusiformis TaxID=28031 RepID=UPI0023A9487C|nr:hypothetical protein [Lysinibacillus fusiformis]WEA37895.1 hypothetical protein PWJ66_14595 [Lysinibacillus fusiformis]
MNKKLFLTAAAIPVALIVPTVASAAETVTVTGQNIVNETLTVHQLPNNAIVNAYQWYYLEKVASEDGSKTSTNKPIAGATSASLKVPVEAAGKTIFVEATTTDGKKYQSEPRSINQLDLAITTPTLEGFSTSDFVAPGETVKVAGVTVTDKAGAKLTSGQITYSYQWFYQLGEGENSFTIIEGASGSTYTIPKDAIEKGIKDIIVKVKAQVGTSFVESPRSEVISISKEPTDTLSNDIKNLLVNDNKYNVSDIKSFEEKIKALESKYQALSEPAKGNVSNYAVLKRALADVDLINKLNEKVDKVGGISDKDLPAYIKEIEAAYDKFDLLQRSLDVNDALYTSIKNLLNEPNDLEEIKEVRRLNLAIVNLLSYSNGISQYVPSDKDSLQGVVNTIEADIAKLSQNYRGAVQNQTILNEAKADIKKVEQFIKSFDKLSSNNTPNKQVTVAKSIRSTYEKLTYKQLKLVPDKYGQLLTAAESAEESQIATLNNDIDSYIGDDIYPINPSASSWQSHVNNVARMVKEYKSLTKASAAQIEGYDSLVTLQKDLKTAEKVIKDMDAYQKLSGVTGVTESKLNSSYTNTLKAYNKLTSLQQSLVYNAQEFLLNTPKVSVDGKVPADKAAAEALKADIAKFADVTKFTFNQLEKAVDTAAQSYKKLSSGARKYVTNNYLLTAAQKDITGVKSFYKKIQTAKEETDAAKQAKKIESVQKAYAKLPANQQHLAKEQYEALLKNQIIDENAPNIKQLNDELATIVSNDQYLVSIDKINTLSKQYSSLSSSDKKLITNYDILKAAIADVKKAESFMKTYEKSFNSNPSTVIKAFEKLTSKQVSLIPSDIQKWISEKQQGQQQTNEQALTLIESINSLLVNGEYIAGLEDKVKDIRTKYDALSAQDKKIVKNYSKLTQAESDLKKVADVHALYKVDGDEAAQKAWQSAYGKLSKKLELLYKNMYPQDTK